MTSAEKFRYFRHARRLTQKQLALALGITRRAVIYIEAGEREPRIETEQKFQELVKRHAALDKFDKITAADREQIRKSIPTIRDVPWKGIT